MDGIKQRPSRPSGQPHSRQAQHARAKTTPKRERHAGQRYWLVRSLGKVAAKGKQTLWRKFKQSEFAAWPWKSIWSRAYVLVTVVLFLVSTIGTVLRPFLDNKPYYVSPEARAILPRKNIKFGTLLRDDAKTQALVYNQDASAASGLSGDSNQPRFGASFSKTASQGIKVSDTVTGVDMTLKPKFSVLQAKKEDNQIFYKLARQSGVLVYTARTASVKEDIILENYSKDTLSFEFELSLQAGLEARLEKDGSVGIYGSSVPINGNVSTGSENDAKLLEKARENAKKDKLLFQIPAPVILEAGKQKSKAETKYELNGNTLKVIASKLNEANYPLSIDPTVYIETAAKLMRGNNETNTDFDVDNELIQKSQTTGARIDQWTSTNNLSTPVWGQGTAVAGGYIYSAGGSGGTTTFTTPYDTAGSFGSGTGGYVVPAGVTSVTVKVWGAGGGGGAGVSSSGVGGAGGGGGYAKSVLTVTPGETLTVVVGSGGTKAGGNRRGGDGGGYSAVLRSGTYLLQAGGGGGGGGAEGTSSGDGGAGGAGGGANGVNGTVGEASGGGGGARGTNGGGGAGGTAGLNGAAGAAGIANAGGDGGGSTGTCNASVAGNTGGAGGFGGGGAGGDDTSSCEGGGGGGGGRYGGGGGGSVNSNNRGAGGGGGGSSLATGTSQVETAGSGTTPGNNGDTDRGSAGDGGTGGTNSGNAASGNSGKVVISYTSGSTTTLDTVSWAKFNTSTNAIESPNPGTGACSGWCSNSAYNLPAARKGLSLIAYNGYLYAIGGANNSGTPQTSVYIAKLGANGEPQLWHPTDSNKNNWVYWYTDTALSNARSQFGAAVYNNHLYLLGGLTTSTTLLSSNTVQHATIRPNGTLSSWTTTGMSALSSNRYGLTAQVYNDSLYVIGGNTTFTGSPITTVEFVRLNSDGTMNSWLTASSLITSGRQTMGGSFSTIFGGYLYVAGGCTAVNGSGYCTAIASDVQLASINADGSLGPFNTILNLTNQRIGHTLIAWQGGLYRLGGCRAQDSGTGDCTNTVFDVDYGVINQAGDASTVATSVDNTSSPCNLGSPYNCSLPSGSVGNMLNVTALVNGYLYIMGGCTNNACTTYSTGVTYQAIGSDGSLQKPASCTGSYSDSYCVSSSSLPTAISAAGVTVFNNRIYVVGGFPNINNIYYVSVNSNGSLGTWQNNNTNTGTTTNADNVSYTFAYARANPSSAGTNPGNLFVFGGCGPTVSGIGCSDYSEAVYKCNITTTGTVTSCSTTSQLQIGTVTGANDVGLGAFGGAVYANYIYLMGGLAPNVTDLTTVRYAKFDNNNNVVTVGSGWVEGTNQMNTGRRRGAGFGYNGYLYILGGYDGADAIADIEFAKINVSDGSWETFSTSNVTIQKRWALSTVVSNSYAYVIGGCIAGAAPSSCSSRTNTIQTFQIYNNDSGTAASYGDTGTCASIVANGPCTTNGVDRFAASAAIMNGYIYMAGGCTAINCFNVTNRTTNVVSFAPINADGTIGQWNITGGLVQAAAWGKLLAAGGTLYYVGGQNTNAVSSATSTVYYAVPNGSGGVSFSTATKGITNSSGTAQPRTQIGATVWNNRIYVVGGFNTAGTAQSTVYVSPSLSSTVSGGDITSNWSSGSTSLSVARAGAAVTAYANNLYVFGGNDGTNYLNDGQYSQINSSTGDAGSWTYTTSLPTQLSDGDAFAANGYMYILGGRQASSTCNSTTLVSPISANTTIATGNSPTGVGEWYQTNVKYTEGRYGAAAVYERGKAYIMGGGCSAMVAAANRTTSTTLLSQPQVAKYSRLIDTDTNVFPNSWLMNGIDNSIGARWQASYQSAYDASNVVLHQSFDDGSDGNNVTTGNSAYDNCYTNNNGTNTYSSAQSVTPGLSMRLNVPTTPGAGACQDDFTATTTRYDRFYVRFDSYAGLSGNTSIYNVTNSSTGDTIGNIRITTTGTLQVRDQFTTEATSAALAANTWHRIEVAVVNSQMILRTFEGANLNGTTPTQTFTINLGNSPTQQFTTVGVGIITSINSGWGMYVDDHKASSSNWVGPAYPDWGQTTNYGDVTLGDVATYTPKDSSGANTQFSRWHFFFITIDASRTFGYPEDVARGPTITDLSLFFTADPSKRLRHGKTFTGGELQPLDTPCRQSVDAQCPLP